MLNKLPYDIMQIILLQFDNIYDIINISNTNKEINNLLDDKFFTLWGKHIYSIDFYDKAHNHRSILSNPLPNMKIELLRLNKFNKYQRIHGFELWKNEDYYMYWENMEKAYFSKRDRLFNSKKLYYSF